jgi:multiple sugar transport system permease protein
MGIGAGAARLVARRSFRGWRKALSGYLFIAPFMFFFLLFVVGPIFFSLYMSVHRWELLGRSRPFIGLGNYQEMLTDDLWWLSLRNTVYFAVFTAACNTVVSLLAALAVLRPIRGQTFYRVIFYAPVVLSVAVMGIICQWLLNTQFGFINYVLGLVGIGRVNWLGTPGTVIPVLGLATVWWGFGFPMLVFIAGLQNIPAHLYEAARIDGAGNLPIFFRITLPLLQPTILFVVATQLIAHFQVFGQSYIMTGGGPGRASQTAIMYLYQTAWRFYRMGYGSTLAIGLAVVIIIFTLIQFRFFGERIEY